jgi:thermostable 8-oxoguanine DNA glycosylase
VNRDQEIAWSQTGKGIIANTPFTKFAHAADLNKIYKELGYRMNYKGGNDWVMVNNVNQNKELNVEKRNLKKEYLARQLYGATAKDAVYILKKNGYNVIVNGIGKVAKVSFNGSTATLELKN